MFSSFGKAVEAYIPFIGYANEEESYEALSIDKAIRNHGKLPVVQDTAPLSDEEINAHIDEILGSSGFISSPGLNAKDRLKVDTIAAHLLNSKERVDIDSETSDRIQRDIDQILDSQSSNSENLEKDEIRSIGKESSGLNVSFCKTIVLDEKKVNRALVKSPQLNVFPFHNKVVQTVNYPLAKVAEQRSPTCAPRYELRSLSKEKGLTVIKKEEMKTCAAKVQKGAEAFVARASVKAPVAKKAAKAVNYPMAKVAEQRSPTCAPRYELRSLSKEKGLTVIKKEEMKTCAAKVQQGAEAFLARASVKAPVGKKAAKAVNYPLARLPQAKNPTCAPRYELRSLSKEKGLTVIKKEEMKTCAAKVQKGAEAFLARASVKAPVGKKAAKTVNYPLAKVAEQRSPTCPPRYELRSLSKEKGLTVIKKEEMKTCAAKVQKGAEEFLARASVKAPVAKEAAKAVNYPLARLPQAKSPTCPPRYELMRLPQEKGLTVIKKEEMKTCAARVQKGAEAFLARASVKAPVAKEAEKAVNYPLARLPQGKSPTCAPRYELMRLPQEKGLAVVKKEEMKTCAARVQKGAEAFLARASVKAPVTKEAEKAVNYPLAKLTQEKAPICAPRYELMRLPQEKGLTVVKKEEMKTCAAKVQKGVEEFLARASVKAPVTKEAEKAVNYPLAKLTQEKAPICAPRYELMRLPQEKGLTIVKKEEMKTCAAKVQKGVEEFLVRVKEKDIYPPTTINYPLARIPQKEALICSPKYELMTLPQERGLAVVKKEEMGVCALKIQDIVKQKIESSLPVSSYIQVALGLGVLIILGIAIWKKAKGNVQDIQLKNEIRQKSILKTEEQGVIVEDLKLDALEPAPPEEAFVTELMTSRERETEKAPLPMTILPLTTTSSVKEVKKTSFKVIEMMKKIFNQLLMFFEMYFLHFFIQKNKV